MAEAGVLLNDPTGTGTVNMMATHHALELLQVRQGFGHAHRTHSLCVSRAGLVCGLLPAATSIYWLRLKTGFLHPSSTRSQGDV